MMKVYKLCNIIGLIFLSSVFISCGSNEKKEEDVKLVIPLKPQKDTIISSIDTVEPSLKNFPYFLAYDKALSLWGVPFEEKDLDTKYGKAHVIVCGPKDAEPLVLLHGMNASSTMWYPNIKDFSKKYHVFAIDFLLEPGKSSCEYNISETSQIVKWYYEIFDQLKLQKFNLLGASRGGWLAMNIALHNSSRINKMILLSPAQTFIWIRPGLKVLRNLNYTISPKRKKLRNVLETLTFDVDNIDQVFIDEYYLATKKASIHKCFVQMRPFSDKELKSLKIPVLVLIGDQDIINNEKSLERAKRLIKNIEVGTIKDAGHFLSIDKADIIDKTTIEFLDKGISKIAKK